MRPFAIRESSGGEETSPGRNGLVAVTKEGNTALRVVLSTGGEMSPDLSIELQPDGWAIYCQIPNGEGYKVTLDGDRNICVSQEL